MRLCLFNDTATTEICTLSLRDALPIFARRASYRSLRAPAPTLLVVSVGLLLAVLAIGTTVNGATRWLQFGPAVFQPSELAKLADRKSTRLNSSHAHISYAFFCLLKLTS